MKKTFNIPEMNIYTFQTIDLITTSGTSGGETPKTAQEKLENILNTRSVAKNITLTW